MSHLAHMQELQGPLHCTTLHCSPPLPSANSRLSEEGFHAKAEALQCMRARVHG